MTGCTRGGIEGRRGKRPVALGNGKCSTAAKSMTNGGGGAKRTGNFGRMVDEDAECKRGRGRVAYTGGSKV